VPKVCLFTLKIYFIECEIVLNGLYLLFGKLESKHHSVIVIGQRSITFGTCNQKREGKMKKILFFMTLLVMGVSFAFAQTNADIKFDKTNFIECEIVLNGLYLLFGKLESKHHSVIVIGQRTNGFECGTVAFTTTPTMLPPNKWT